MDEDLPLDALQEADEQREAELAAEVPEAISEGEDSDDDDDNDNDPVVVIEVEFVMASHLPRPSLVVNARSEGGVSLLIVKPRLVLLSLFMEMRVALKGALV
ncbi:hypothetical protein N7499_012972 [Penicillium canescens]|uniref:Uncharacterized protein n=1 Tax=Penicillium canescens TaxID=5083 RepID=A0AAD6I5U1_PENCN|nr:uncharacterized protein N7446_000381 [Penicillium canescens]KAJ6012058.1 hypothetical protein N7522_002413 [Penicillium canescens]KAJ6030554.1 hypothetical protein N7460_010820 [Penicillium canescens]KAJ6059730.1 hypothetical protein N7444_003369 [Penicillium canescens]KAJ6064292.1 hypothetical protein N7499_012972 [Penicillium canescens]KAJ6077445.1 hypothetical protein N7446_000381 [Penicillium canescens]